jgi:hypothetical protein
MEGPVRQRGRRGRRVEGTEKRYPGAVWPCMRGKTSSWPSSATPSATISRFSCRPMRIIVRSIVIVSVKRLGSKKIEDRLRHRVHGADVVAQCRLIRCEFIDTECTRAACRGATPCPQLRGGCRLVVCARWRPQSTVWHHCGVSEVVRRCDTRVVGTMRETGRGGGFAVSKGSRYGRGGDTGE